MERELPSQRLRVYLSKYAFEVIQEDGRSFPTPISADSCMNLVFSHYYADAAASIDTVLEREAYFLRKSLEDLLPAQERNAVVHRLVERRRQKLLEDKPCYPKEEQRNIRLTNQNFRLLYGSDFAPKTAEERNYRRPAHYFKAVLEEYARLPSGKRERILCADQVKIMEEAIRDKRLLEVVSAGRTYRIRPYAVATDTYDLHCYLAGYSAELGSEKELIASFRITRLTEVTPLTLLGGALKDYEKDEIRKRIQDVGIQYLLGTEESICVRLSSLGEKMFRQRLYARPVVKEVKEDTYSFQCTQRQAFLYFFTFTGEAEVLSPPELREMMREAYQKGLSQYWSEEETSL